MKNMSTENHTHWLSGVFKCAYCGANYTYSETKHGNLRHNSKKGCENTLLSFQVELVEWLIDVAMRYWFFEQAETGQLRVKNYMDTALFGKPTTGNGRGITSYRDFFRILRTESPQVLRRHYCVSPDSTSRSFCSVWYACSYSAGGT